MGKKHINTLRITSPSEMKERVEKHDNNHVGVISKCERNSEPSNTSTCKGKKVRFTDDKTVEIPTRGTPNYEDTNDKLSKTHT